MKKIILSLIIMISILSIPAHSAGWSPKDKVNPVGKMILKKNSLPSLINFEIIDGIGDNKYSDSTNIVQINICDLIYTKNEDEVAYIIARELGDIINNKINNEEEYYSFWKRFKNSNNRINKKTITIRSEYKGTPVVIKSADNYNNKAEMLGIDLMVNSGYNPLASIAVLTKMPDSGFEIFDEKIDNFDKALFIYNYLAINYPSKVKVGYNSAEYENFLKYIEQKYDRKKLEELLTKQKATTLQRRKQLEKYRTSKEFLDWGITYELLQSITEPEMGY